MNTRFFAVVAVSAGLAGLLSGCASTGAPHMAGDHGGSMMHGPKDMQAMCDMHKQMMSGKSDAEQRAIMDEHMKKMSPQMREHMQSMRARCQ